jgi:hypothetical protein
MTVAGHAWPLELPACGSGVRAGAPSRLGATKRSTLSKAERADRRPSLAPRCRVGGSTPRRPEPPMAAGRDPPSSLQAIPSGLIGRGRLVQPLDPRFLQPGDPFPRVGVQQGAAASASRHCLAWLWPSSSGSPRPAHLGGNAARLLGLGLPGHPKPSLSRRDGRVVARPIRVPRGSCAATGPVA